MVGRQTGGPHVRRHVGERRAERAGHPATGAAPPARHPALPSVQLFRSAQQHSAVRRHQQQQQLRISADDGRPSSVPTDDATTAATIPDATTTTAPAHDRLQRSTRSQP